MQPDPIGFKGDGSNLYRYCGNDWANRMDPMGLEDQQNRMADQQNNDPKYDPNYIGGSGSGQFDKMQNMGASQVASRQSAHDVEKARAEVFSAEAQKAIENGPKVGQLGQPVARQGDQKFAPGQKALDDARDWIAKTHPELHPEKYKILDGRLSDQMATSRYPGKILVDTRQHREQWRVVQSVAHELMHKQYGVIRTGFFALFLPKQFKEYHSKVDQRAFAIGQEYVRNPTGE